MKNLLAFVFSICVSIAASAQLNSDTASSVKHTSADQMRRTSIHDHLHPKVSNIANQDSGFDIDGTVYKSEGIVNRHATNIQQLIR
jgi:hypothetical protein